MAFHNRRTNLTINTQPSSINIGYGYDGASRSRPSPAAKTRPPIRTELAVDKPVGHGKLPP